MRINTETLVGLFMISAVAVFLFMSFKIGVVRFDAVRYAQYVTYFSDVSGLNEKADIVVAGVKVGWVRKLSLVNKAKQVRVDMMIDRGSVLYSNAYGVIRQNGLLGTKYVEIIPGDASHSIMPPGSTLTKQNKPPVAIDELLASFKDIADNVQQVSASLKEVLGDRKGVDTMNNMIADMRSAFKGIENVTQPADALLKENNQKIHSIVSNLESLTISLRDRIPDAAKSIQDASVAFQTNIKDVSASFSRMSQPITDTVNKIKSGEGVLGALVSDEKMLKDVKMSINSVKNYFDYVDRLGIDFDMHVESMYGRGNDLDFKDSKGYMNMLVSPSEDYYYLLGITSSYDGIIKRTRTDQQWYNQEKQPMVPDYTPMENWAKLYFAPVRQEYVRHYDAFTWNLQFARTIGRFGFRAGLFESTFGMGVDYDVPLLSDARWLTTLEAYRFYEFLPETLEGRSNFAIERSHLKWLNRIYFNDSLYFVFGADDIISKYNKNYFVGMGLAFGDDNIKYILPKLGVG